MKIVGILIIVFGLVDLVGSYASFDLWGAIGIELPDLLWSFSAYIEMAIGYVLMRLGSNDEEQVEEASAE